MTTQTSNSTASNNTPANTPSSPIGNLISAILFVGMIVSIAFIYSLGNMPESKFNDAVSQSAQRGVDYMFEKTTDGQGVAVNVALRMGWDRTPLLTNTDIDKDRYVVARLVYPQVAFTEQGAADMLGQLEKDTNSLLEGETPVNFEGFATTSPFSVAANNMTKMGPIPMFMTLVLMVMATVLLGLGIKEQFIRFTGYLTVFSLLMLLGLSVFHYTGVFTYTPIHTTALAQG